MPAVVDVDVDADVAASTVAPTPAEDGTVTTRNTNSNTNTTVSADSDSKSSSNNNNSSNSKVGERARGRWQLLRRAIVRSAATTAAAAAAPGTNSASTTTTTATTTNSDAQQDHSIHSFAGYHLLPPSAVSVTRASLPRVWEQLLVLHLQLQVGTDVETESAAAAAAATEAATTATTTILQQTLVDSILALTAMDPDCRVLEFSVSLLHEDGKQDAADTNAHAQNVLLLSLQQDCADWSLQLQRQCAWKKCDCQWRRGGGGVAAEGPEPEPVPEPASASVNATSQRAAQRWIMLRIQFEPVEAQSQYTIREYSTNTNTNSTSGVGANDDDDDDDDDVATSPSAIVLARERVPTRQVSLQELVSHHHQRYDNIDNRGIDNTGNICVWDCEKTLAWVLLQEQKQRITTTTTTTAGPRIVTELGAGMVGLAGLCLIAAAVANHDNSKNNGIQELYLTDGHVDSVQNNRVHVRLGQAAGGQLLLPQSSQSAARSSSACRVHCSVLKWSIESGKREIDSTTNNTNQYAAVVAPPPADWTLISDCTHFEEYHAELFWTLITCTVSTGGGTIWMCQPDRGKSLDRFLDLVRAVNGGENNNDSMDGTTTTTTTTSTPPLVLVQEQHFETLRAKHEELLQRDKTYDPNIHRPRVFCLRKLRAETEQDRLIAIRHIQERVQASL
jgi:hypothetical protein